MTNIIIRCVNGVGGAGNCDDKCVSVPRSCCVAQATNNPQQPRRRTTIRTKFCPMYVQGSPFSLLLYMATAIASHVTDLDAGYQSSPTAGDAACSKNGIVYGLNGTFPVPGTVNTTTSVASASANPSTPANVSTAPYATGTAPGSGGGPNPSISPVSYTGAASSIIALGHKSQILGSAVALLGLVAGVGWFL